MTTDEISVYLADFRRVLAFGGKVFLTAFVEEGVPEISINPPNYRQAWDGELHCVRFDRTFFFQVLRESGFEIFDFAHGTETDGQSAISIKKV